MKSFPGFLFPFEEFTSSVPSIHLSLLLHYDQKKQKWSLDIKAIVIGKSEKNHLFFGMRKFAPFLLIFLFASTAGAQSKFGATPEDSIKCVEHLSLYGEFFRQKNYEDAVGPWRKAIEVCPKSRKSLYVNGVKMYRSFIRKNRDDLDKKETQIKTLMWIYDQRIEHFGQEGYVLGRKGADMAKYRPKELKQAQEVLARSYELQGGESEVSVLAVYFRVLMKLHLQDQSVTRDELDNKYREFISIVESRSVGAKGKKLEQCEKVRSAIETMYQKVNQ